MTGTYPFRKLYQVVAGPDRYGGSHQRVIASTPDEAIEATRQDWASRFPAWGDLDLHAYPCRLDKFDPKALDAETMEWVRCEPGDEPGDVTTARERAEAWDAELVRHAIQAWRDGAPAAAERVNGLRPDLRRRVLDRLGYSALGHQDILG